ncbi:uncharacterized protein SPPG_04927 [Spizellomyces punctatus DAOM BR117]|uniref:C2H2-type domain-containing protein n=1 Tax=Spizellomyces punctatus (strain DAOM BR117) TaxID=645134 RepID=A0A0L0HEL5_SPIPD|nr:uncharacterized protein SPPG_04927 [Spizellomyces punctatus DAOM BR117]KNC99537.1 hypothetical protein SPPG_04927 [Spizellomyces punctatus DAOM BR117]|eukprot:XP_016607577.1 hypothetical protein SPPG_04927 [Spizellomyces punctatus DAOM BR117]
MGKKKRKELKPWCWYCDREFEDEKVLFDHQRIKHFKCTECGKKLNTAGGMVVHMDQVHKMKCMTVSNALPGRESTDIEIFGMEGVPEADLQAHYDKVSGGGQRNKRAKIDVSALTPDQIKQQMEAFKQQQQMAPYGAPAPAPYGAPPAGPFPGPAPGYHVQAGGPPYGMPGPYGMPPPAPYMPPGGGYPYSPRPGMPPAGIPQYGAPPFGAPGPHWGPPRPPMPVGGTPLPPRPAGPTPPPPMHPMPPPPTQPAYSEPPAGAVSYSDAIPAVPEVAAVTGPTIPPPVSGPESPVTPSMSTSKAGSASIYMVYSDNDVSVEEKRALNPKYAFSEN